MKLLSILIFISLLVGCSENNPVQPQLNNNVSIEKTAPDNILSAYLIINERQECKIVIIKNNVYAPVDITLEQFNFFRDMFHIPIHH